MEISRDNAIFCNPWFEVPEENISQSGFCFRMGLGVVWTPKKQGYGRQPKLLQKKMMMGPSHGTTPARVQGGPHVRLRRRKLICHFARVGPPKKHSSPVAQIVGHQCIVDCTLELNVKSNTGKRIAASKGELPTGTAATGCTALAGEAKKGDGVGVGDVEVAHDDAVGEGGHGGGGGGQGVLGPWAAIPLGGEVLVSGRQLPTAPLA